MTPSPGAHGVELAQGGAGAGAGNGAVTAPPPTPFDKAASFKSKLGTSDGSAVELGDKHSQPQMSPGVTDMEVLSSCRSANHDLIVAPPPAPNPVLRALRWYLSWAVPGMGMFSEAYMIFSIGNIKPFLKIDYPQCWGIEQPQTCNESTVDSIEYVEICGIIAGMLALGFAGDIIGRKWGSRLTMLIMFVGGVLLTASTAPTDSGWLAFFLVALFFYGVGVGGEYPMASSSAAERAEGCPETRKKRGEITVLTFSQQGWGNWANTLVILLLLAMQGATGAVSPKQAEIVWRVQFAIGTFICLCVTVYRWLYLEESEVWKAEKADIDHRDPEEEGGAQGLLSEDYRRRFREFAMIIHFYWPRLFITCMGWFINDFAFYGNKLFQSTFIALITNNASQYKQKQYTLLNSTCALVGYYFAAFTIDRPFYGRRRLQAFGFLMLFILFLLQATLYETLVTSAMGVFQFLYFFASFWNQFGPNCTTWLVAGEVFPTDVRASFHGLSAAFGKAGAAVACAVFTRIDTRDTFYASAFTCIAGFVLTVIFLPDTTGLDLGEIDRMNRYMMHGQYERHYHGEAKNPKYLSYYERMRGYGRGYDAERDAVHRKLQEQGVTSYRTLSRGLSSGRSTEAV